MSLARVRVHFEEIVVHNPDKQKHFLSFLDSKREQCKTIVNIGHNYTCLIYAEQTVFNLLSRMYFLNIYYFKIVNSYMHEYI